MRVYTLAAILAVFVVVVCHERKLMLMCAMFWGIVFPLMAQGLQKMVPTYLHREQFALHVRGSVYASPHADTRSSKVDTYWGP